MNLFIIALSFGAEIHKIGLPAFAQYTIGKALFYRHPRSNLHFDGIIYKFSCFTDPEKIGRMGNLNPMFSLFFFNVFCDTFHDKTED